MSSSFNDSYPLLNNQQYIIAGPGSRDYFNHSPGFKQALTQPGGSLGVVGNIGSLLTNDPYYKDCTTDLNVAPNITSSPNCTVAFKPDVYTTQNTCGDQCITKYPESYGQKDFGFPENFKWQDKFTNSYSLHSYQNQRASHVGNGPAEPLGALEFIPRNGIFGTGFSSTGFMDPQKEYQQVGNFLELDQFKNLAKVPWSRFVQ